MTILTYHVVPTKCINEKEKYLGTAGLDILTKDINAQLSINWREKAIHKMNKPPCYIESDCYWK